MELYIDDENSISKTYSSQKTSQGMYMIICLLNSYKLIQNYIIIYSIFISR